MVTPGRLRETITEVLGVPESTVTLQDRLLAEAGLRAKGGRGRSAAKMTSADAANLLIAVAGSSVSKDAPQIVRDYSALPGSSAEVFSPGRVDGNAPAAWALQGFHMPTMAKLDGPHTFADALSALIDCAGNGELDAAQRKAAERAGESSGYRLPAPLGAEIRLFGPFPQATIVMRWQGGGERHHYGTEIPFTLDKAKSWEEEIRARGEAGDLRQIREFSIRTLRRVGEMIYSGD